jgi:putative transposase
MLGMRESYEDWLELGRDLIARGVGAPMLIVADGAPGLINAIEQCWPASDRQHCSFTASAICWPSCPSANASASARPTGKRSMTPSTSATASNDYKLVDQLAKAGYTAAARCLADDLDALVVHLRYPLRHRRRWRSTNLLERSLGEVKRTTKVTGRFPGETSCLTLV